MLNGGYSQVKMSRFLNSRAARAAEIPAGNGIGNARSLAKMYAATIGEIEGARLLKRDGVNRAWTLPTDGLSQPEPFSRLPMKYPLRFALGYELGRTGLSHAWQGLLRPQRAGGHLAYAHPESGTAVGYDCNHMAWVPCGS